MFGPRQAPFGAYAAVIPKWVASMLKGEPCLINGDGETSRDFCFIRNVVQANLRAGITDNPDASNQVYNVAVGDRTTLNQLHAALVEALATERPDLKVAAPVYQDFRAGDVRHSLADVSKASRLLGYAPTHDVHAGLRAQSPTRSSNWRCALSGVTVWSMVGWYSLRTRVAKPWPANASRYWST